MRVVLAVLLASLAGCASEPTRPLPPVPQVPPQPTPVKNESSPDWSGPPLQVTSRVDGGIEVELQAPTAGHAFELVAVQSTPQAAVVRLRHRTPGDAFVAQVITPLRVAIVAARLGGKRRVELWIGTQHGPDGKAAPDRLAFVLLRP